MKFSFAILIGSHTAESSFTAVAGASSSSSSPLSLSPLYRNRSYLKGNCRLLITAY